MAFEPESDYQDPSLHWAAAAEAENGKATVPDGSHESITLPPHGHEPVTEAPQYQTPLHEVADHLRASVPDSLEHLDNTPVPFDQAKPATENGFWTKQRKAIAAVVAVAAVGGGVFGIRSMTDSSSNEHAGSTGPVPTVANDHPTSKTSTKNTKPTATNIPSLKAPETTQPVGNLDLAHPYAGPHGTFDFTWRNETVSIPKLVTPNSASPSESAISVLNMMAELVATQQTETSQGMTYFTDNAFLQQYLKSQNSLFQSHAKGGPYTDQLEFFDSPTDPAQFELSGTDDSGNPVVKMTSGTLYAQRVSGHTWQDPTQHNPKDAIAIKPGKDTGFSFGYKLSPDGTYMLVESLYLLPNLPAIANS